MNDIAMCPHCGKPFSKKGIGTHIWRVHGAGRDFDPNRGYKDGTRHAWNKGLTRETSPIVDSMSSNLERKKTPLELQLDDDGKLNRRWINKRVNARKEGVECKLTFDEYCTLVKEAGLVSSQLGFTGENYVLARYNDSGDYEVGNCRFITQKENSDEKNERLFGKDRGVG